MENKDILMACELSLSLQVKFWGLAGKQSPLRGVQGLCLPDTSTAGSTASLQVIWAIQ